MIPVFLLLLASLPLKDEGPAPRLRVVLAEDTIDVPNSEWRSVEVALKQQVATVECNFRVINGPAVRVALLGRREIEALREGRPGRIAALVPVRSGMVRQTVPEVGDYFIVIDNSGGLRQTQVDYRVSLLFPGGQRVRTLDPARRWTVVAISLLLFAAVAAWAGSKLAGAGVFREWK